MNITLRVMERDEHGVVQQTGTKVFGPVKSSASDWVKAPRKMWWGKANKDVPHVTSAVKTKNRGYCGKVEGTIGYFHNDSNNVMQSQQLVGVYSWPFSNAHGVHVFPENFRRCLALFTARKAVKGNWINDKDEYSAPNEEHPDYEQWVNDCHVYSLFQSSSNQSSLRNIDYKGTKWNIENEFFWMSNAEMLELADEAGFDEMYNDALTFSEDRYMFKQLQSMTLSDDAQALLDLSKRLVRESMKMRKSSHKSKHEMHLASWDAGWYQARNGVLEEFYPNEYKAFVEKFKALEDRLREGVFEFGFLNP